MRADHCKAVDRNKAVLCPPCFTFHSPTDSSSEEPDAASAALKNWIYLAGDLKEEEPCKLDLPLRKSLFGLRNWSSGPQLSETEKKGAMQKPGKDLVAQNQSLLR